MALFRCIWDASEITNMVESWLTKILEMCYFNENGAAKATPRFCIDFISATFWLRSSTGNIWAIFLRWVKLWFSLSMLWSFQTWIASIQFVKQLTTVLYFLQRKMCRCVCHQHNQLQTKSCWNDECRNDRSSIHSKKKLTQHRALRNTTHQLLQSRQYTINILKLRTIWI